MTPTYRSFIALVALLAAVPLLAAAEVTAPSIAQLSAKAQVAPFLAAATGNQEVALKVGDFMTADLDGDGERELLASVDYSGRDFFNTLIVVWQRAGDTRVQEIDVWNMETLAGAVQDLDGDGQMELLVQELLTPYLGVRPYAVWTSVKSLEGAKFVDSSSRFPTFYEAKVLPPLEEKLARLSASGEKHLLQVIEVSRDKVLRTLGRDLAAGLQSALRWAAEPDPLSRIYAAAVLREIEDPSAAAALERLASDSDSQVAAYARSARASRERQ